MPYKDPVKQAAWRKQRYPKEEWAAYIREWRKNNPELDKEYNKHADRNYRLKHPERLSGSSARWRRDKRLRILEFFGNKCVRCGFNDPRALEMDHINGDGFKFKDYNKKGSKRGGGGEMNSPREFLMKVLAEPDWARSRFQLLCANCHRIKTDECLEYAFKRRIGNWFPGMTNVDREEVG